MLQNPVAIEEEKKIGLKRKRVAFQGEKGAYSERVIGLYCKGEADSVPCRTFYEVVDLVQNNKVDMGILPVENSIIGCITHSYDLLLETKLNVVSEVILPINHCLLALESKSPDAIKKIFSHPAAIAQCEVFLRRFHNVEIIPTYDTAGSVKLIQEKKMFHAAAIASAEAAETYGMQIVEQGIEDYPHNQTRFLVVSNEKPKVEELDVFPCKTSVVFDTLDQPGMLCKCLEFFDEYNVNLTLLESRPHKTEPWKYHFFADFKGHVDDDNIAIAMKEVKKHSAFLYVIGSYPRWSGEYVSGGSSVEAEMETEVNNNAPLYSLERKPEPSVIDVDGLTIGGNRFTIIAGPCSVEGRHQMVESAKIAKEGGAHILRGGAFKPRTSPYSFQGLREEGLKLLKEAGQELKMPVITEVISVETLPLVAEYADILQVGARNMQNFVLLTEIGMLNKPVVLKRGMMATLNELLLSAEYILERGNKNVILCERGIRTFETATRNTLDLSAVPYLKQHTHLPVLVDPSQGTGVNSLILPMAKAALAVGADGLMIEVHVSPSTALSDGSQSLDAKEFKSFMKEIQRLIPVFKA